MAEQRKYNYGGVNMFEEGGGYPTFQDAGMLQNEMNAQQLANRVSGFGKVIGGAADWFSSRKRKSKAQRDAAKAGAMVSQTYDKLFDTKDTISSGTTDSFELSTRTKGSSDPILQNQANLYAALEGQGPRSFSTSMNKLDTTDALQDLNQANLQREISGAQAYGQVQQDVNQANLANQRNLLTDQLGSAKSSLATAEQNIAAADAARQDAFKNMAAGAIETGLSFVDPSKMFGAENGIKMPLHNRGGSVMNDIMQAAGGMPPVQGPMPGPASHDTNPLHIVDNNGDKQGEVMGEEFIIRSDMAQDMSDSLAMIKEKIEAGEEPSQEEWMEFYDSVDSVIGLPQFQDNLA